MDDTIPQLAIAADGDEPPSTPLRLELIDATRSLDHKTINWLHERTHAIARHLDARGDLRVRFVDDAEMCACHERHLNDPSTTDVITFDLTDGASAGSREFDLDLLVCIDEAQRNAHGNHPRRELLLYILHGVLHALGEDDVTEHASRRMHAREDEILRAVGVGAVYAPDDSAHPDAEHHDAR